MDHTRLKRLAGINEAMPPRQIMDPDEQDRLDDERYERERKITALINSAFQRIGLSVTEDRDGVLYDEEMDREAIVFLDDQEADLDVLWKLKQTGLSDKFEIGYNRGLMVTFNVAPELDHAVVGN